MNFGWDPLTKLDGGLYIIDPNNIRLCMIVISLVQTLLADLRLKAIRTGVTVCVAMVSRLEYQNIFGL